MKGNCLDSWIKYNNKNNNYYNSHDYDILIEYIRKHPSIFDYDNIQYKNVDVKENEWKTVATAVGKFGHS